MQPSPGPDRGRLLRAFVAGGGCGFLAGAVSVLLLVSQFGSGLLMPAAPAGDADVADSRPAADPADLPGAAARPETPVATAGEHSPTADAAGLASRDLVIPVEGVGPEGLVRSFHEARGDRTHEALDILAPRHTPVRAVDDGKVARLFYSKAGGITLYQFDPTEQYCYYYAHLERYAEGVAEGQPLRKGQVIGYVGTSGNAPKDTPHLHFAIFRLTPEKRWWEGTPVDPYDVLH